MGLSGPPGSDTPPILPVATQPQPGPTAAPATPTVEERLERIEAQLFGEVKHDAVTAAETVPSAL